MNATSWPPEKRFLRDTETAAWYGVSIDKLRWDRCHAKRVLFVKVDGRVFYDTLVVGPIIAECFGVPVRPLQYAPSAPSRTVAIAQEAARRLEQPGHCAGYLQTALAGADRVKLGAAVALLVRGGSPEVMRMAQGHIVDAVQRVALTEAADEQRPGPRDWYGQWRETQAENAALRELLREWYGLFAPVRREGTEGAQLLDRTQKALATKFRYAGPNAGIQRASPASGEAPLE